LLWLFWETNVIFFRKRFHFLDIQGDLKNFHLSILVFLFNQSSFILDIFHVIYRFYVLLFNIFSLCNIFFLIDLFFLELIAVELVSRLSYSEKKYTLKPMQSLFRNFCSQLIERVYQNKFEFQNEKHKFLLVLNLIWIIITWFHVVVT